VESRSRCYHRAMRTYAVYILTNRSGTLYVGMTNDLRRRLEQHRAHAVPGFTKKYRLDRLIHAELFPTPREAMVRERQLKGWRRAKKVALIESENPQWRDLAELYLAHEPREAGTPQRWSEGARRGVARWSSGESHSVEEPPGHGSTA
jgi:putative endonuclease